MVHAEEGSRHESMQTNPGIWHKSTCVSEWTGAYERPDPESVWAHHPSWVQWSRSCRTPSSWPEEQALRHFPQEEPRCPTGEQQHSFLVSTFKGGLMALWNKVHHYGRPRVPWHSWWEVCWSIYMVLGNCCRKGGWWWRTLPRHVCLILWAGPIQKNVRRWGMHILQGFVVNVRCLAMISMAMSTIYVTRGKRKLLFCWLCGSCLSCGIWPKEISALLPSLHWEWGSTPVLVRAG